MAEITTLVPWFGSNRMLAQHVGAELAGASWVAIPFAGGMTELLGIKARTIMVNDLHRHVINLARVVASPELRPQLVNRLRRKIFHPNELSDAQDYCREHQPDKTPSLDCAENYFVCCWMGRSSKSGIDDEFNGRPAFRWNASGGDSVVRYHTALRSIVPFAKAFKRCQFETMDAFELLARCEDTIEHAIYADPPFPKVGRRYRYNAGNSDAQERTWHIRLRDELSRFKKTRVVCRFYDHPLIRELYPKWTWRFLKGRDQANNGEKPEVLLINGRSYVEQSDTLF